MGGSAINPQRIEKVIQLIPIAGIWLAAGLLFLHQVPAHGAEVVIACRADLSAMGGKVVAVQIAKGDSGALQARIDGTVSNENVKLDEHAVRVKLDFKTNPYSPEYRMFNDGEISLAHLNDLMNDKEFGPLALKLPFDLRQVRKMKIYDLQGKRDKFGGTVLMEAYSAGGKLLGRVFRSLIAGRCI